MYLWTWLLEYDTHFVFIYLFAASIISLASNTSTNFLISVTVQESDAVIATFMGKAKSLTVSALTQDQILSSIQQLVSEASQSGNTYISKLLAIAKGAADTH